MIDSKPLLNQIRTIQPQPKVLMTRLTPHGRPDKVKGVQDFQHPLEPNYENQMVGVLWHGNSFRFNILMSDGSKGNLVHSKTTEIRIA